MTSEPRIRPDEFETIAKLLRPLAEGAIEARGLLDDVAVVPPRPGFDLVLTKDAMVEGVHFLPEDPLDLVARKLLRVNLSDLAAKAAEPYGYLLSTSWSERCSWAEREAFARGLAEDQARYGIKLFGGDTTSTPGPLTLSITALGWVPHDRAVSRRGAQPGDLVLVTGTIGDARLGLRALKGELPSLELERLAYLSQRYQLPEPRTALIRLLRESASAAIDVSDGLVADVSHIARASGVAIELELEKTPLSRPAKTWLDQRADPTPAYIELATSGDDYEIAFTAEPQYLDEMLSTSEAHNIRLTVIGRVTAGRGTKVRFHGAPVDPGPGGWRHV